MNSPSSLLQNTKIIAPIAILQSAVYFVLNHWPLREPTYLPLTCVDHAMPLLPWTIWLYLLMIPGQIMLALLIDRRDVFRQTLTAYVAGVAITLAIHAVWPTAIERPTLPPDDAHGVTYRMLCDADTPNSCFPSGHIVGPAILVWGYFRTGVKLGPWFLAAFVPVSLCILTIKQHYFVDWLGAYAISFACISGSEVWSAWRRTNCP
jgi:hypothetical protein